MDLDLAARRLEAIGNPMRLRIYLALAEAGSGGLAVGTLQRQVGLKAPSTLSHHLRRLIEAGVVRQERSATTLTCLIVPGALNDALALLPGNA